MTPFRFSLTLSRVNRDPQGHPLERITRRFYRSFVVLERRLSPPLPKITPTRAVELGSLDPSEIAEYLEFHPGRQRRFIEHRFAAGDVGFTARYRGELVASGWGCRSQHWVNDLRRTWRVEPGEVYFYDSYTAPEHRGHDLNPAMFVHALGHFRALGLDRATVLTVSGNAANLRAKEKLGFERRAVIRSFSLGWGKSILRRRSLPAPETAS